MDPFDFLGIPMTHYGSLRLPRDPYGYPGIPFDFIGILLTPYLIWKINIKHQYVQLSSTYETMNKFCACLFDAFLIFCEHPLHNVLMYIAAIIYSSLIMYSAKSYLPSIKVVMLMIIRQISPAPYLTGHLNTEHLLLGWLYIVYHIVYNIYVYGSYTMHVTT